MKTKIYCILFTFPLLFNGCSTLGYIDHYDGIGKNSVQPFVIMEDSSGTYSKIMDLAVNGNSNQLNTFISAIKAEKSVSAGESLKPVENAVMDFFGGYNSYNLGDPGRSYNFFLKAHNLFQNGNFDVVIIKGAEFPSFPEDTSLAMEFTIHNPTLNEKKLLNEFFNWSRDDWLRDPFVITDLLEIIHLDPVININSPPAVQNSELCLLYNLIQSKTNQSMFYLSPPLITKGGDIIITTEIITKNLLLSSLMHSTRNHSDSPKDGTLQNSFVIFQKYGGTTHSVADKVIVACSAALIGNADEVSVFIEQTLAGSPPQICQLFSLFTQNNKTNLRR